MIVIHFAGSPDYLSQIQPLTSVYSYECGCHLVVIHLGFAFIHFVTLNSYKWNYDGTGKYITTVGDPGTVYKCTVQGVTEVVNSFRPTLNITVVAIEKKKIQFKCIAPSNCLFVYSIYINKKLILC